MKFYLKQFYTIALHGAVVKGNIAIVKLLLTNNKIDINLPTRIFNHFFKYNFISIKM